MKDVVYVRTPRAIGMSRTNDTAAEHGTWTATWSAAAGPAKMHGDYMAVWRRNIGDNGIPSWTLQSELFAALGCEGAGCVSR